MADKIHLRIKAINLPGAAPALISSLPLPLKHKSPTGPPGLYDTTRVPRPAVADRRRVRVTSVTPWSLSRSRNHRSQVYQVFHLGDHSPLWIWQTGLQGILLTPAEKLP